MIPGIKDQTVRGAVGVLLVIVGASVIQSAGDATAREFASPIVALGVSLFGGALLLFRSIGMGEDFKVAPLWRAILFFPGLFALLCGGALAISSAIHMSSWTLPYTLVFWLGVAVMVLCWQSRD